MTALALTVLGASLVGSLHCAGMCGGFVAFYAAGAGRRAGLCHAAYNVGRLAAYALLGALAGALGAALDLAAAPVGIQRAAAMMAGALIVLWGGATLLETLGARVPRLEPPAALRGAVARGIGAVAGQSPPTRALAVGLLTGLLPCGWLYAFIVTAAGTGDPLRAAGLMAVFWLGTLPVMAGLGVAVQALAGSLRRWLPAACAVAMIVVGLLAITGRARPPEMPSAHHAGGAWVPCSPLTARLRPRARRHALRPLRPRRAGRSHRRGSGATVLLSRLPRRVRGDPRARPRALLRAARLSGDSGRSGEPDRQIVRRARRSRLPGPRLLEHARRARRDRALPRGRPLRRLRLARRAASAHRARRRRGAPRPAALARARALGSARRAALRRRAAARRARLPRPSRPRPRGARAPPPGGPADAGADRARRRRGGQRHGHRLRALRRRLPRDGARVRVPLPLGEPR